MTTVEVIEYDGLKNCIRLSNGIVEVVAITSIGPRIIRYGFIGGPNEFYESSEQIHHPTNDEWQIFGGHRLWFSPEALDLLYAPDCSPVDFLLNDKGFILNQPTEIHNGLQKSMSVTMNDDGSVEVVHRIKNNGLWPVEIAVWALSVMAPNGLSVIQNPSREIEFLPNRTLTLWPYTKMNDPRVTWGDKYTFLRQSPEIVNRFKFGIPNEHGWASYFNHGNLFLKRHVHVQSEIYPDDNCSYETFTNADMLEIETLSPLVKLQPGEFEEHYERWELYKNISSPQNETDVDKILFEIGGTHEER